VCVWGRVYWEIGAFWGIVGIGALAHWRIGALGAMEALALWRFGSLGHCRIEALGSETVTPNGAFTAASAGIFAA